MRNSSSFLCRNYKCSQSIWKKNKKKKREMRLKLLWVINVKMCFICSERVALWFYMLFYFFILGLLINTCLGMTKLHWQFTGIISLAVLVRPRTESARTLSGQLSGWCTFLGTQLITPSVTSCADIVLDTQNIVLCGWCVKQLPKLSLTWCCTVWECKSCYRLAKMPDLLSPSVVFTEHKSVKIQLVFT